MIRSSNPHHETYLFARPLGGRARMAEVTREEIAERRLVERDDRIASRSWHSTTCDIALIGHVA